MAITSEWTLVKWSPLTHAPSLTDANGYFYRMVRPNPRFPAEQSVVEGKPELEEGERELRAQIELVPQLSYMTTHMGFAGPFPEIQALVKKLAAEYGLLLPGATKSLGPLYGSTDSGEVRAAKIAERLETLEPGWTTRRSIRRKCGQSTIQAVRTWLRIGRR